MCLGDKVPGAIHSMSVVTFYEYVFAFSSYEEELIKKVQLSIERGK